MVWQRCGLWLSCSCRGGVGQWAQGSGARKAGGTGGDDCPNEAFPFYSEAGDQRSQLESWWTGCRTVKTICVQLQQTLLKVVPVTVCWVPVFTDGNLSVRLAALRFDFQPGVTHTPIPMAQWCSRVEWQTLLLHFLKIKMGCSGWKWEPMFLPVVLTLVCKSIMTSFTLNKIQGVLDVVWLWCLGLTNKLLKTKARNYEAELIIQIVGLKGTPCLCVFFEPYRLCVASTGYHLRYEVNELSGISLSGWLSMHQNSK